MWKLLRNWQMIAEEKKTAWSSHACRDVHYLSGGHLVAIGVHGGQDVDACVVDQPHDPMVSSSILLTEKLGELNEQLTAEHLVAVHVAHVLELRLHWGGNGEVRGGARSKSHTELPSVTFKTTA